MEAAAGDLEGGGRNIVHSGTQALSEFARSELHLDNSSSSCLLLLSFLITPPSSFPLLPVPADTSKWPHLPLLSFPGPILHPV